MKNKRILLSSLIMMSMSFGLMSCSVPDEDHRPPDETTEAVTQETTPAVSVTSEPMVTALPQTQTTTTPVTTVKENDSSELNDAEYEYDSLGRLIKVKYDESNFIEYEYDANGNITKISKTENADSDQ